MAKKKKSGILHYVFVGVEIVLLILLICTLAMPIFSLTTEVSSGIIGSSSSSTSLMSATEFISNIFNGDITGFWAIATLIFYFLTLLLAVVILLVEILKFVGVKISIKPKALEILLVAVTLIFFVLAIIFGATNNDAGSLGSVIASEFTMAISWAVIISAVSAIGCLVAKFLDR